MPSLTTPCTLYSISSGHSLGRSSYGAFAMFTGLIQQYKYCVLAVVRSKDAQRYLSHFFPSYLDTICDRQRNTQMSLQRWTCCRAIGSTVSKAASNCQLLQGLPQLQSVAPPNMMTLPGRLIPGDWVGCVCKDPASWAQCPQYPFSKSPTNHPYLFLFIHEHLTPLSNPFIYQMFIESLLRARHQ